jgi:hypothetical protein
MMLRMPLRHFSMLAVVLGLSASAARADFTPPRPSPHASVAQTIGTTELSVSYSRPGVKGRAIWGELVPWDKPWRTGANEITQFKTTDDILVEGQPLPAGAYGLVTIPAESGWTIAFTKDKDLWGAYDYKPEHDQLRVTVKAQAAPMQERMSFTIEPTADDQADVVLAWDKLRVPFHVGVDVNGIVLRAARAAVAAAKPDDWITVYRAANWAFTIEAAKPEAAVWTAAARKSKENFQTLSLAAKLLARDGNTKGAIELGTKALTLAKTDTTLNAEFTAPFEKTLGEWRAKP